LTSRSSSAAFGRPTATVGREFAAAAGLDNAIEIAPQLGQTLDMPQRPDAMTISDSEGNELYFG
jgi:hypothetical protein